MKAFRASVGRDVIMPDAIYTDSNSQIVLVEADSGNYTKSQILAKQAAWRGIRTVWGQPSKASTRIGGGDFVYKFA